jgi:protein-arginine kinase activator protein McsA
MLCDKCHERDATCHTTTIVDGVARTTDLCDRCFDATASPDVRELTENTRTARCQYCGGSPCSGGTDFYSLISGVKQMRFMCVPCTQEYHRYTQQALQRARSGLSQQEQLVAIQTLCEEADQHMKRWVSERDSP